MPTADRIAARPTSLDAIVEAVRAAPRVLVRGNASKPGLAPHDGAAHTTVLDAGGLDGIVEHDPSELTVTVRAGTPVAVLDDALAAHGQHLPFDPPRADLGATIGGTIAAGLSGSGAYRHGGGRDFLIGVTLVDGRGRVVRGGGKVVKNAAGFDLPKLMVGSRGRLGVLVELTFKVFPRPRAYRTLRVTAPAGDPARRLLDRIAGHDWGLACLDYVPPSTLWLRLAGDTAAVERRAARLAAALAERGATVTHLVGADDAAHWRADPAAARASGHHLVKIPTRPDRLGLLEDVLPSPDEAPRRYTAAGNVCWLGWPKALPFAPLDDALRASGHAGLSLDRRSDGVLGSDPSRPFLRRLQRALDPDGRFPAL